MEKNTKFRMIINFFFFENTKTEWNVRIDDNFNGKNPVSNSQLTPTEEKQNKNNNNQKSKI